MTNRNHGRAVNQPPAASPDRITRRHRQDVRRLIDHPTQQRVEARWHIIQTANEHKLKNLVHPLRPPVLYGMRQVHRAVFHCRQHRLLKPEEYAAAGFNPEVTR